MKFDFRRLRVTIVLAAFLPALFVAACGGGGAATAPENVFIAYEADSGRTVTMGVGDALQITLPENRSTGYVWSVVTNDEAVLSPSDEPAYATDSDAEGAAGRVTFVFRAAEPGTSVLRMVNAQSQDTAVDPQATFELTVQVTE